MQKHIAVFIDWENIELSVKNLGSIMDYEGFVSVIRKLNTNKTISGIFAYGDFDKGDAGLQTKLVRLGIHPKHVVTKTAHEYIKGAADIELSLDIMQLMYENPHISDFMVVSGDGDLLHIIRKLRLKGKNIHVLGFKASTSRQVIEAVDTFTDINEFGTEFMRKITATDLEKRIRAALSDKWIRLVIQQIEHLNVESNKKFMGLNYLRTKLTEKYDSVPISEALTECLDIGLLETYPVENPRNSKNPTTACKLNYKYIKEPVCTKVEDII